MKKIRVEDAVGMILCHDVTQIVPGKKKGPLFSKGHIIEKDDVPELLNIGKDHIYVWEQVPGRLHEDEAGIRLARAIAGDGVELTEPKEGKVNLTARNFGLLKIDVQLLESINSIEELAVATLQNNRVVKANQIVCGTRVIPLVIEEKKIRQVEELCVGGPGVIGVKEFHQLTCGLVTTGNEVYYGRIKDAFGPVIGRKLEYFGSKVLEQIIVPDDKKAIIDAMNQFKKAGCHLIITTGGMSVDPDDLTPTAIREGGAKIISYGAPVLPGSMLMLAYLGDIPILGLPGCVMYHSTTVFDLVLPRILVGEKLSRKDIIQLGHGGLC
ncbi:MAG TPA: molybdopterin-binding protein, partial [Clostridia bacterium]|nr:molybdopterin-binding protein [Clostridia bacterium]